MTTTVSSVLLSVSITKFSDIVGLVALLVFLVFSQKLLIGYVRSGYLRVNDCPAVLERGEKLL